MYMGMELRTVPAWEIEENSGLKPEDMASWDHMYCSPERITARVTELQDLFRAKVVLPGSCVFSPPVGASVPRPALPLTYSMHWAAAAKGPEGSGEEGAAAAEGVSSYMTDGDVGMVFGEAPSKKGEGGEAGGPEPGRPAKRPRGGFNPKLG